MNWNLIFPVLIIAVLVLKSLKTIRAGHFGVVSFLGKPLNWVLSHGTKSIPPFLTTVKPEHVYSREPQPFRITFSFITKDNREVTISGTLRCVWNPYVLDKETGIPRVIYITPKMIKDGLESKLGSEIGRFGGLHPWIVFRRSRREVENFLNSILRLPMPPHVN